MVITGAPRARSARVQSCEPGQQRGGRRRPPRRDPSPGQPSLGPYLYRPLSGPVEAPSPRFSQASHISFYVLLNFSPPCSCPYAWLFLIWSQLGNLDEDLRPPCEEYFQTKKCTKGADCPCAHSTRAMHRLWRAQYLVLKEHVTFHQKNPWNPDPSK